MAGGAAPATATMRAWPWVMRAIIMAAAVVVVSSLPLRADTIYPVPTFAPSAQTYALSYATSNWSGYVAENDLIDTQPQPVNNDTVTAVSGSWIVPKVKPSTISGGGQCLVWVGIDGFSNNTVEQIGTGSLIVDGQATYGVFYEMYPGSLVSVPMTRFTAGQSVTASVTYNVPSNPDQFQLSFTDNTSGYSFTVYGSSSTALRSSAEWIAEAPTLNGSITSLPQFGSVTFTNAQATIITASGSMTGPIDDSAWQSASINMANGGDAMSPGPLTASASGTSSFTVFQTAPTPEPSTLASLAAAVAAYGLRRFAARQCLRRVAL
jgi:hypothetical protein